jgi:peptidoglycan/xylan/chitin deacetylase (PgdA/CDA1 family)
MENLNVNLWRNNTPSNFWLCQPDPPQEIWDEAICKALPLLSLPGTITEISLALEATLGESRFGPNRYQLGMSRRIYYLLKPLLPRSLTRLMRTMFNSTREKHLDLNWPIEPRFAQFQWEVLKQVLILSEKKEMLFKYFWPEGKNFAFVLTHDIETAAGQRLVPVLADLEETLGFHSLFNFVPERYPLDHGLLHDLRQRGFEIGIHGLKHDGKLFNSYANFVQRAQKINAYLAKFRSTGFRSPLTLRNPAWMQMLKIDYDLSFFDTDPYEPMPGGVMSVWPFMIGHFLELPYTLSQDYTLFNVMGETSPKIWLEKIDFLEKYHGMALVNVHPDYSSTGRSRQIYEAFLRTIKDRGGYWHVLPQEIANWWRNRANKNGDLSDNPEQLAKAALNGSDISITIFDNSMISASRQSNIERAEKISE